MGDTFRRAVSRQVAPGHREIPVCSLYTRWGPECVGHAIQALTDPDSTVLLVDGIRAFDLVSREAMLSGLRNMEGGDKLLPFVVHFHGHVGG